MKVSKKSREINEFLNNMMDREELISSNVCVICGRHVTEKSFRDAESLKEYSISGMCQQCQDEIFE